MSYVPQAFSQRQNLASGQARKASSMDKERRKRLNHAQGAVSKPAVEVAPPVAAAPAAPAEAAEAPAETLAILGGSVSAVESALATGDHDAWLDQLLEAEKAGKNRKTAISAIEARM